MTPSFDARGKIAFVTGAASGLGKAVAGLFSEAGAEVAGLDLKKAGAGAALALAGDVASEGDLREAVSECVRQFSKIHYVIHAAGAVGGGKLVDTEPEDWRRLIDVNLSSAYLLARATHEHLSETGGCLVLVSSPNGVQPDALPGEGMGAGWNPCQLHSARHGRYADVPPAGSIAAGPDHR